MSAVVGFRTSTICVAVLWASLPLGAQTGQSAISGHVLNTLTGEMIPGATVRLVSLTVGLRGDLPTATSQADGSYRFDSLPAGRYLLLPEKDGFVATLAGRNLQMIDLGAGQFAPDLQIPMVPAGSISGTVADQNGTPVAGVRVQAFFVPGTGRASRLQPFKSSATSDSAGRYSLAKVDPGNYFLLASPDQKAFRPGADGYTVVDTFYPQARSISEASPLSVAAGQDTNGDIKLRLALTYHVQGKVSELPAGTDAKSLRLEIAPGGDIGLRALSRSANVNPDLSFSFERVVSGHYELFLTGPGSSRRNARRLLARQEVEVGSADLSGLVLRPIASVTLTGSVVAQTANTRSLNGTSVRAVPIEDLARGSVASALVGAEGTFTLSNLEPTQYLISVQSNQPGVYVASLTLNQRDILNQAVDLSDLSGGQIVATLRSGAGQISGIVNENPSIVILVPRQLAPDASNVRFAYTQGATGQFVAANVAPGDYLLFAAERSNPAVWATPVFLQAIQNLGQAVHLEEGVSQSVELTRTAEPLLRDQALRLGLNFP